MLLVSAAPASGSQDPEDANEGGPSAIPLGASITLAADETAVIVQSHDLTPHRIIDPAGLAYLSNDGSLLISDSEINEEERIFNGFNMWELSSSATLIARGLSPEPGPINKKEPTGLAYNPSNGHAFLSNDLTQSGTSEKFVYEIASGADGNYGTADDTVTWVSVSAFGATDPEDVAYDWAGTLGTMSDDSVLIADGTNARVLRILLGSNGTLDSTDPVMVLDLSGQGIVDIEGLGYKPSTDTILTIDGGANDVLYEMTKDGQLLRSIDLSALKRPGINMRPSDVTMAPASDGSPATHIYLVDRGDDNNSADPNGNSPPRDGVLYELTAPFTNLAPFVDAGPDIVAAQTDTPMVSATVYDDGQPTTAAPNIIWSRVSGPGPVNFGSPNAATTSMSFSQPGTYVVKIEANDGILSAEDTLQVTVTNAPPPNAAPTVSAGADREITLPTAAVLVDGVVSDDGLPNPPGDVTSTWSKVSGPGTVTIKDPNALDTTVSFSSEGTYVLRLTAHDGALSATDDLAVVVDPEPILTFDDIAGHTFEADIIWLAENGITFGCNEDGTLFCPDDSVTRAQMASFLVRAYDLPSVAGNRFADVSGTHTANINALAEAGITLGCNADGTLYCPNDPVTRAQMGSFLARASDLDPVAGDVFIDVSGVHEENINAIASAGITLGCDTVGPLYCPDAYVTRGQMAAFLHRALG